MDCCRRMWWRCRHAELWHYCCNCMRSGVWWKCQRAEILYGTVVSCNITVASAWGKGGAGVLRYIDSMVASCNNTVATAWGRRMWWRCQRAELQITVATAWGQGVLWKCQCAEIYGTVVLQQPEAMEVPMVPAECCNSLSMGRRAMPQMLGNLLTLQQTSSW